MSQPHNHKTREIETMGRKAKKSGSGAGTLVVAIVMAIIFAPKGGWTVFRVFLLGCVLVAVFGKKKEQAPVISGNHSPSAAPYISLSPSMPTTHVGPRARSDDGFLTVCPAHAANRKSRELDRTLFNLG